MKKKKGLSDWLYSTPDALVEMIPNWDESKPVKRVTVDGDRLDELVKEHFAEEE